MTSNRPPDLKLKGANIYIINPEALPQAQKRLALKAYKMWRAGELVFTENKSAETGKEPA